MDVQLFRIGLVKPAHWDFEMDVFGPIDNIGILVSKSRKYKFG